MKYIITESKYNDIVTKYLNDRIYPDYGWIPTDEYESEINAFGYIDFYINDKRGYSYVDGHSESNVWTLVITRRLNKELTDFFGLRWKPIFKEWFETNTGLEVGDIINEK
jgi:hypothetical protein